MFTEASLDFTLDPQKTLDIPDITFGDELFSNGCGLMARKLAVQVAKKMGIKFRNVRYTPRVFQIRYRVISCRISRILMVRSEGISGIRAS